MYIAGHHIVDCRTAGYVKAGLFSGKRIIRSQCRLQVTRLKTAGHQTVDYVTRLKTAGHQIVDSKMACCLSPDLFSR